MDGGFGERTVGGEIDRVSDETAWYVLQLKPGGLDRAQTNLARQRVQSFMPKRRCTTRRGGRLVDVSRPLFPGYLFIEVGRDAPAWRSINATYGVAKAVCLDPGRPVQIPGALIGALKAASSAEGEYVCDPDPFLPGEAVRVVAGPFANTLARIDAAPAHDRIFVLLNMMGRDVRAALCPRDLERT